MNWKSKVGSLILWVKYITNSKCDFPWKVCRTVHPSNSLQKNVCYLEPANFQNRRRRLYQPLPVVTSYFGPAQWYKISWTNWGTKQLNIWSTTPYFIRSPFSCLPQNQESLRTYKKTKHNLILCEKCSLKVSSCTTGIPGHHWAFDIRTWKGDVCRSMYRV